MENRKPFELQKLLIWYNLIQVIFSIWLFNEVIVIIFLLNYTNKFKNKKLFLHLENVFAEISSRYLYFFCFLLLWATLIHALLAAVTSLVTKSE